MARGSRLACAILVQAGEAAGASGTGSSRSSGFGSSVATIQPITAASTAMGATSSDDEPTMRETSRTAVNGTLRTAAVPAAIPVATAGVVSNPGSRLAATMLTATPSA